MELSSRSGMPAPRRSRSTEGRRPGNGGRESPPSRMDVDSTDFRSVLSGGVTATTGRTQTLSDCSQSADSALSKCGAGDYVASRRSSQRLFSSRFPDGVQEGCTGAAGDFMDSHTTTACDSQEAFLSQIPALESQSGVSSQQHSPADSVAAPFLTPLASSSSSSAASQDFRGEPPGSHMPAGSQFLNRARIDSTSERRAIRPPLAVAGLVKHPVAEDRERDGCSEASLTGTSGMRPPTASVEEVLS
jgi:hypothetical protein